MRPYHEVGGDKTTMTSNRRAQDELSEHLVVLRCQVGDEAAFEMLFDRYNGRLLYYLRRLLGTGGQAEDVLQTVWLKVVRKIGSLREPRAVRTWMYRIAHNEAVQQLRDSGREIALGEQEEILQAVAEEDDQPPLDIARVHVALDEISPEHRAVLTLRFLDDLSYEQIAGVVGCSLGTVRSRIHYAKRALRKRIEEADDEQQ
jgi:RNA polymerase sigma-70 factor (ECF subfamily)